MKWFLKHIHLIEDEIVIPPNVLKSIAVISIISIPFHVYCLAYAKAKYFANYFSWIFS
jgi:hypothetical protein